MAACVTGLCLTIYLLKSPVPVLTQLPKLGMALATKGKSGHRHMGEWSLKEKKRKDYRQAAWQRFLLIMYPPTGRHNLKRNKCRHITAFY